MCGSYALSYHKLLLEHAQTLSSYPTLTPTAFAIRLRWELQELLTLVTITYTNDYRTWANDQPRRANPIPTLTYPLIPRRSTIAHHDPAQSTEDLTDAEIIVDTWTDMETQSPTVYSSNISEQPRPAYRWQLASLNGAKLEPVPDLSESSVPTTQDHPSSMNSAAATIGYTKTTKRKEKELAELALQGYTPTTTHRTAQESDATESTQTSPVALSQNFLSGNQA